MLTLDKEETMKILEQGRKPSDEFRGRCRTCHCLVSVTRAEVKTGYSGMDDKEGQYVICPMEGCGSQISVSPWPIDPKKAHRSDGG